MKKEIYLIYPLNHEIIGSKLPPIDVYFIFFNNMRLGMFNVSENYILLIDVFLYWKKVRKVRILNPRNVTERMNWALQIE